MAERVAHNDLVPGSNPGRPTTLSPLIYSPSPVKPTDNDSGFSRLSKPFFVPFDSALMLGYNEKSSLSLMST